MKREVNGRVVVITGASSGIGRATALRFAKAGDTVVVAARRKKLLNDVVDECESLGANALAVETDVSDERSVERLAKTAIKNSDALTSGSTMLALEQWANSRRFRPKSTAG